MNKKSRWRKFLYIFFSLFILLNFYILFSGKTFFYKALYYNLADIDDYKIFPERIIHKSSQPQPWPVAAYFNRVKLPNDLSTLLKNTNSIAFLIIKNDSLAYEEYWDGYGKDSYSNSFSMAKSVVSSLIGIAIKEGKIKSVEEKVGDFLPEFNDGDKSKIIIRHLLTMSAGTDWNESYSNPLSITTDAYYGTDLRKIVSELESERPPGEMYNYKSGDTQILGFILQKATGMSLSQYAEEKLWNPLGAENNAIWSLDKKDGMEKAFCCLNSNARDFARFGNLYLHRGNWKGRQIIDSNYVSISVRPIGLRNKKGEPVDYYGYSWWTIPNYKHQNIFYCRGILGQYIIVIPEKKIVMVRLGKHRGKVVGNHFEEVYKMIDAANEMF